MYFSINNPSTSPSTNPSSSPSTSPSTSPSSTTPTIQSVNCIGDWEKCPVICGEGTQKYKITTEKKRSGSSCKFEHDATQKCKTEGYILDCPSNYTNFTNFFKQKYKQKYGNDDYSINPTNSTKVSETSCDVDFKITQKGVIKNQDMATFYLVRNNTNCTWDVSYTNYF